MTTSDASGVVVRLWLSRNARLLYRAGSLIALGCIGPLWQHADVLALASYNERCEIGNRFYTGTGTHNFLSMLILFPPIILARSNRLIKALAILSVFMLLIAVRMVFTASTPPFECVSVDGHYNDRVSGLEDFDVYILLLVLASYLSLLVDWSIWGIRRLADVFGATR
jgi:hypothetical protein